jgi:hypothetical protein
MRKAIFCGQTGRDCRTVFDCIGHNTDALLPQSFADGLFLPFPLSVFTRRSLHRGRYTAGGGILGGAIVSLRRRAGAGACPYGGCVGAASRGRPRHFTGMQEASRIVIPACPASVRECPDRPHPNTSVPPCAAWGRGAIFTPTDYPASPELAQTVNYRAKFRVSRYRISPFALFFRS